MQQKGRVGKSGSSGLGFSYHIWVKVIILVPVHQTLISFSWNLIKPRSYYAITGGFIISSLYRIDGFLWLFWHADSSYWKNMLGLYFWLGMVKPYPCTSKIIENSRKVMLNIFLHFCFLNLKPFRNKENVFSFALKALSVLEIYSNFRILESYFLSHHQMPEQETTVNYCYIELHCKCGRTPRSSSETQVKGINYSIYYLPV